MLLGYIIVSAVLTVFHNSVDQQIIANTHPYYQDKLL